MNITAPAVVSPVQACAGGPVTLSATPPSGANIKWYTGSAGGSSIGSGNAFPVTPSKDTVLWAESERIVTTTGSTAVKNYAYTGTVQSVLLDPGTYTLEVWGANGGGGTYGGKGGYSKGNYTFSSPTIVYVCVGGAGNANIGTNIQGGYNGGGMQAYANNGTFGTGGGATHISTASGLLSNSTVRNGTLIVAGGGGGAGYSNALGGNGGGTTGGNGVTVGYGTYCIGQGGTQSGGGTINTTLTYTVSGYGTATAGSAGQGGTGVGYSGGGGGGGGGWFGGSGGFINSGGGGSSYIGGVTGGTTVAGAAGYPNPSGNNNGYVRITPIDVTITTTCISASRIPVNVKVGAPAPTIAITPEVEVCSGTAVTLTATSPSGTVKWYDEDENWKKDNSPYNLGVPAVGTHKYFAASEMTVNSSSGGGVATTYSYTGGVQTVTLQAGTYEIECWGANGGGSQGGIGGYSKGTFTHSGGMVYVVVGGAGGAEGTPADANGGYNGGGPRPNPGGTTRGSGGGATHISKSSGLLTNSTVRTNIIMVAGGGGGGSNAGAGVGGGGGITGANSNGANPGQGGTQTAGGAAGAGTSGSSGTPGQGGQSLDMAGAGGGGWYGGGAGGGSVGGNNSNGGGGGSGYIGAVGLTSGITRRHTESGFVANPVTTGHGYVRITPINTNVTTTCASAKIPVTVIVSPDINVNITPNPANITCNNSSVTLEATPTGGNNTYSYSWSGGTPNGNKTTVNTATTYSVTVTSGGCTTTKPVTVGEDFTLPETEPITRLATDFNHTRYYIGTVEGITAYRYRSNGVWSGDIPHEETQDFIRLENPVNPIDSIKLKIGNCYTEPEKITLYEHSEPNHFGLTEASNTTGGAVHVFHAVKQHFVNGNKYWASIEPEDESLTEPIRFESQVMVNPSVGVCTTAVTETTGQPTFFMPRSFMIKKLDESSTNFEVTLYFTKEEIEALKNEVGNGYSEGNIRLYKRNSHTLTTDFETITNCDTVIKPEVTTTGDITELTFSTSGFSTIYPVYEAPTVPLPITLTSFTGVCQGQSVVLQWQTATETNNAYFTIERSLSGMDWTKIAEVKGAGNSSMPLSYSYTDLNASNSEPVYYRLKQTDYNGDFEYFAPIVVNCNNASTFGFGVTIYPNPFNNEINIRFDNITDEEVTVEIHDINGKRIYSNLHKTEQNPLTITVGDIAPGVYNIRIVTAEREYSHKLIKN